MRPARQVNSSIAAYEMVDDFEHWLGRARARQGRPFTDRETDNLRELYLDGYCVVDALDILPHM